MRVTAADCLPCSITFNEYVDWLKRSAVDRVALSSAAHAAATARHNEMFGAGKLATLLPQIQALECIRFTN